MPLVVPVKFTYASRDLWFDPQDLDILEADYAICSTERGTEIGLVTADPFEVPQDEIGQPLKPVLRVASDIDLQLADDLAIQGDEAMVDFRRLVKELDLEMKPVGVEYLFGGEKAVFYFAAEERVDFRQLVKDLSSTLHIRVDMRQIGVRDETRLVGGYAQCGQELCCTRFGGQFEPVSIRMAKEQDLPLNSSKISAPERSQPAHRVGDNASSASYVARSASGSNSSANGRTPAPCKRVNTFRCLFMTQPSLREGEGRVVGVEP